MQTIVQGPCRNSKQEALVCTCTQVEKVQAELDGLAATLKQVELYNEQMKGEIAVTRRSAHNLSVPCDITSLLLHDNSNSIVGAACSSITGPKAVQ